MLPVDQHLLATGDDNGELKVWDLRKGGAVLEARQHEEYISAMAVDGAGKILLTARYCGLRPPAPCVLGAARRAPSRSAAPFPAVAMAPWESSTSKGAASSCSRSRRAGT